MDHPLAYVGFDAVRRTPSPPLLGTEPALEVVAKAGDGCDGLPLAPNRLQVVVDGPRDWWIGPPLAVRTSTLPARPARVGASSPTRPAARTHRPSTWCRLTRADAPSAPARARSGRGAGYRDAGGGPRGPPRSTGAGEAPPGAIGGVREPNARQPPPSRPSDRARRS